MNRVKVERETYVRNGKEYFGYFIKGNLRGVDVKAKIMPPEFEGYAVLDIVFGKEMAADLIVTPYAMKDDFGKTIRGNTYSVRTVDTDGTVYECPVKPANASAKAILSMILAQ